MANMLLVIQPMQIHAITHVHVGCEEVVEDITASGLQNGF